MPGMRLATPDGETRSVLGVERRLGEQLVFSLEIDGVHTYFVGHAPVLVHNEPKNGTVIVASKNYNSAFAKAMDWLRKEGVDLSKVVKLRQFKYGGLGLVHINNESVGFRIEWDPKIGNHINVFAGKKKAVEHFTFPGNNKSVKSLLRLLYCR